MILTVIFADTFHNELALVHQNEYFPFQFRTVHIELTPEQIEKLKPHELGKINGQKRYEQIWKSYLERQP